MTFITGLVGNAANFTEASTFRLQAASNAALEMGDIDFTVAFWVNFDTPLNNYHFLVGKDESHLNGTLRDWSFFHTIDTTPDMMTFGVFNTGGTGTTVQASNLGLPATGTWYLVIGWHDSVNNTLNIQVNNGTPNSLSYSGGVRATAAKFYLGGYGGPTEVWHDGRIDELGIWKRVLTSDERTDLYNGGSGRDYAYIVGGGGEEEVEAPLVYYAPMLSFGIGIGVN